MIYQIELFTQAHYKESIEPDENLSELYKDLFFFHWKEEVTHALMDELEWPIEDQKLTPYEREQAVTELIDLVSNVDGILQAQAAADVEYFSEIADGPSVKKKSKKPNRGDRGLPMAVHFFRDDASPLYCTSQ